MINDDDDNDNNGNDDGDDDDNENEENGNVDCGIVDDDLFTTARLLANAQAKTQANTANARHLVFLSRKIRRMLAVLEHRRWVGCTIDLSYNLGNLSHFDVNEIGRASCRERV
jgi:hypothetical protein